MTLLAIPSFPNIFPYNELLLSGKLDTKDGMYGLKTRTYHIKPGWRVFYTSKSRVEYSVANRHGMPWRGAALGALVGIGYLAETRVLTKAEWERLLRQFNNIGPRDPRVPRENYGFNPPIGIFFRKDTLRKFRHPVLFTAQRGPVRTFPVPIELIADALREVAVDPYGRGRSKQYRYALTAPAA